MTAASRARLANMIGNALEWYDFAIYGYFAAVLGKHFFPSDDPRFRSSPVRMSCFSVSYNVAYAAIGGTAPLVAAA